MKFHQFLLYCSFLSLFSLTAKSEELLGVDLEEVITVSPGGEELRLRGAAVKTSAQQAIYIGGLYLQDTTLNAQQILESESEKRFILYSQDSTLKPDALLRALNLGINVNHSEQELNELSPMLEQFNAIWNREVNQGDKVWVDYLPGKGTAVSVNGEQKAVISGQLFYKAFLKSWIGEKPLSQTMKKQLLGND